MGRGSIRRRKLSLKNQTEEKTKFELVKNIAATKGIVLKLGELSEQKHSGMNLGYSYAKNALMFLL
jgi:hypothetical protein